METFKINGEKFNIKDINIILINEQCWMGGTLYYFITIFEKNASYNYYNTKSYKSAKSEIADLKMFFLENNVENFACLDNECLINMDNLKSMKHYSNLAGAQLVEAKFKNGSEYPIYEGWDRKTAEWYIQAYNKQEDAYTDMVTYM